MILDLNEAQVYYHFDSTGNLIVDTLDVFTDGINYTIITKVKIR